jgi:hypothetical protein
LTHGLFTPKRAIKEQLEVVIPHTSAQLKCDMDRAIGDMVVKKLEG